MNIIHKLCAYYHDRNNNQILTIVSFAFLTGWVISFPYEGPVFYALIAGSASELTFINTYNLFFLAMGLLIGIFITPSRVLIKRLMQRLLTFCLIASSVLPLLPDEFWIFSLPAIAFAAGMCMTLNGHQIKKHFPRQMWSSVAPDTIILACLIAMVVHILVNIVNFIAGFVFIEIILAISLFSLKKVDHRDNFNGRCGPVNPVNIPQKFWLLFVFIFAATINAGIMFQTIFPRFANYTLLSCFYTNLPYIAAIVIFSKFYKKNKFNLLYVSLALWGCAFLLFSQMDTSRLSFFLMITCMLFAAGIFDLFWWTIITTSFGYVKNPATMFGAILSVNVLGSWTGGIISNNLNNFGASDDRISSIGLLLVMVSMVLIVPLNRKLSPLLESNEFFESPHWNRIEDTEAAVRTKLSARELEVFEQLRTGSPDKEISSLLNISLNTVKSHNRKIYNKLEVKNRTELKRYFNVPD